MALTCTGCEVETSLIYCDHCHLDNIEFCLENPDWVEVAKTRKGDLPNENLFQTFTREKEALEQRIRLG